VCRLVDTQPGHTGSLRLTHSLQKCVESPAHQPSCVLVRKFVGNGGRQTPGKATENVTLGGAANRTQRPPSVREPQVCLPVVSSILRPGVGLWVQLLQGHPLNVPATHVDSAVFATHSSPIETVRRVPVGQKFQREGVCETTTGKHSRPSLRLWRQLNTASVEAGVTEVFCVTHDSKAGGQP